MKAELRFDRREMKNIAGRYEYRVDETEVLELCPKVMGRGYLSKSELTKLAHWKSARSAGHTKTNGDDYVCEITRLALSAKTERARIEVLTSLDGVSWPTASVILHFFHRDQYPILDFRALWSLSLAVPSVYTFGFWHEYVDVCRSLAKDEQVCMRTLDKALWQYSKEKQKGV